MANYTTIPFQWWGNWNTDGCNKYEVPYRRYASHVGSERNPWRNKEIAEYCTILLSIGIKYWIYYNPEYIEEDCGVTDCIHRGVIKDDKYIDNKFICNKFKKYIVNGNYYQSLRDKEENE